MLSLKSTFHSSIKTIRPYELPTYIFPLHCCKMGGGGERGITKDPPRQIFKKLVHKNSIKPKMVYPPRYFSQKALTPQPQGIWQKFELPQSWVFNRVHLWLYCNNIKAFIEEKKILSSNAHFVFVSKHQATEIEQ